MTIGKVITVLIDLYNEVKNNETIEKPISYSLYHTWKRCNAIERSRKEKQKDTEFTL